MVKRSHVSGVALLLSVALLSGCGQSATPESTDTLNVTVSI